MGVSSPIVARGPAHPIAQAARVAVFSRSHGATHVKRVPGVVSHFVHELAPPSHTHSESEPEGQGLPQAPPDGGSGASDKYFTVYLVLHVSDFTARDAASDVRIKGSNSSASQRSGRASVWTACSLVPSTRPTDIY